MTSTGHWKTGAQLRRASPARALLRRSLTSMSPWLLHSSLSSYVSMHGILPGGIAPGIRRGALDQKYTFYRGSLPFILKLCIDDSFDIRFSFSFF